MARVSGNIRWAVEQGESSITVTLEGALDERFDGAAIVAALSELAEGSLTLDLAGISQINSDGVARWLGLIKQLLATERYVILQRCSPPVVHQISMVSLFAEGTTVRSILAPYHCDEGCKRAHLHLVERKGGRFARIPDRLPCPHCGRDMVFDDVHEFYSELE